MIKVALMVPIWGRHEILKHCYQNWVHVKEKFEEKGIKMDIHLIVSSESDRDFMRDVLKKIYKFAGFNVYPNHPMGDKLNKALEQIIYNNHCDYIMTTGSDDELTDAGVDILAEKMHDGINAFGFTDIMFRKWGTDEQFSASYPVVCGAFRTIKRSVLLSAGYSRWYFKAFNTIIMENMALHKGEIYLLPYRKYIDNPHLIPTGKHMNPFIIWPPEANKGLDTLSGEFIESCGYTIEAIQGPFVIDNKSDVNIHSYESVKGLLLNNSTN